eukprot:gene10260-7285_t
MASQHNSLISLSSSVLFIVESSSRRTHLSNLCRFQCLAGWTAYGSAAVDTDMYTK